MQDDPPEDEPEESQSENSDVDDGDAVDVSGIEIEVGTTDGGDSNAEQELPQNLVLGDSLTGDIESIVASDIFNYSVQRDEILEIGWQRDVSVFDDEGMLHAQWDIDLGEFLNDVDEDPDAATMLGTANEFDLDAEGSSTDDIEDAMHPNANEFNIDAEKYSSAVSLGNELLCDHSQVALVGEEVSAEPSDMCSSSLSFSQITVFPSPSHVWISLTLTASHTLLFTIAFMIFAVFTNAYLKLFTPTQFLIILLIWVLSYGLISLTCDAIYFMRQIYWALEFRQHGKVLENESGDDLFPEYSNELPQRIPTETTVFIALLTAVIAVTSYAVGVVSGAL
ncbi:MAG: hypothetical protein ACR2NI_00090 [Pirellulales bacterium]